MSQDVVPPKPGDVIAAGIVFPVIGGALVALRFWSKSIQRAQFTIEDWFTIPAFVFTLGMGITLLYGVSKRGLAYPAPQPPDPKQQATFQAPEITAYRQVQYALEMMHCVAITCVKLSFLFFYKRIFVTPMRKGINIIVWTMIVLSILWGLGFLFSFMFACGTHFSALWTNLLTFKQHCQRIVDVNFYLAPTDFALDVFIFLFPMPMVWGLRMSTTRKLAVAAVFMVGGVTLAASITRMVLFIRVVHNIRVGYTKSGTGADLLTLTAGLYWTMFETGMALIAACLPALYALIKRFAPKHMGIKSTRSGNELRSTDKLSGLRSQRSGHVRLEDSQENIIPLQDQAVVVTTDIRVDNHASDVDKNRVRTEYSNV